MKENKAEEISVKKKEFAQKEIDLAGLEGNLR